MLLSLVLSMGQAQNRIDTLYAEMSDPNRSEIIVVANQGDWHGTIPCSIHALQKAYDKGAKVALVDICRRADGQIILGSDPQSLETPTLEEALHFCQSKILLAINADEYLQQVLDCAGKTGCTHGIILTGSRQEEDIMYMPTLSVDNPDAIRQLEALLKKNPIGVLLQFSSDDSPHLKEALSIMKGKSRVVMSTVKRGLAGDRQDASPRDDAASIWGTLIEMGATVIVTDQTKSMMNYLMEVEDEQLMSQKCGMTDWIDPIHTTPVNTGYVLYPTPHRGEGTQGSCMVYLPRGYDRDSLRRYPVIYYLHGMHDSQRDGRWLIRMINTAIMHRQMRPVIIVCPQAMPQGYYMNGNSSDPKVVTGPIEDVLIHDLIPYIDRNYRTVNSRQGRALEGFSMGGRGALMLGFKHPEMFCAVSSVSGAVVHWDEEHMKYALEGACGDVDNPASKQFFEDNHPIRFARDNANKIIKSRMHLRFFVGTEDHLLPIVTNFTNQLKELGIPHTFKVVPQAHHKPLEVFAVGVNDYDFSFWDNSFSDFQKE